MAGHHIAFLLLAAPMMLLIDAKSLRAQTMPPVSHHQHKSTTHSFDIPKRPPDSGRAFTEPPATPVLSAPTWYQPSSEAGQLPQVYTLDELLRLATQNNPTLRQAQRHIDAELARSMQAGLYPNPVLSYVGEQIGLEGTAGEWQGFELEQRLVTAGKLDLSRNKYQHRAKVAQHLAVAQQFRVCNDVRIHFVKTLAAMQILNLKRELLKTSEDHLLTVREMYNLGQANKADAHRAIALLQAHRLHVLKAENNLRRQRIELTAIVGLDCTDPIVEGTLSSDRTLIDFDEAYQRILECSPQLLAAYAKLNEDSVTVRRESVEWIPDIVISGGSGYNSVDRQTTAAARVSIEVPLFDRNQGTIRQAQLDYSRQRDEVRRTQLDLRRRLATEYDLYLTAHQHAYEHEAVIVPAKREAYRLTLESYKANRAEWEAVLKDHEDYTNARIMLTEQQRMQRVSEILINGHLLHDGLQTPDGPLPGGHIDSVPKPR